MIVKHVLLHNNLINVSVIRLVILVMQCDKNLAAILSLFTLLRTDICKSPGTH